MSRTARSASAEANFCGRAAHGVSGLGSEEMRQIEAHRSKERPTPWAHLAARYRVNEIDLRRLFEPANDDVVMPKAVAPQTHEDRLTVRDKRFVAMWKENAPRSEIMLALGISASTVDHLRARLRLPKRLAGRKPNEWGHAEDEFIRNHYILGGKTALWVAEKLGRTRCAVIGRAARNGWSRRSLKGVAA